MKTNLAGLCLAIWILFIGGSLWGDERILLQGEELNILVDPTHLMQSDRLKEVFPQTQDDIERLLGWRVLSKPLVVLVAKTEVFEQMSGSPYISAFAVPQRHLIVLSLSRLSSEPYLFNVTFKHELCHLVLHDHIRDSHLPKWLDEGVCQWVSGSLGELVLAPGRSASSLVDLSRHSIPLEHLSHSFPQDKYNLVLAYEESRSFVEYITSRYGSGALLGILNHLKEGKEIHRAVAEGVGKTLDTLEDEWLAQVKKRTVWLVWIGQYLYEILFAAAALLTVIAFIKLRIRKRRLAEDEEGEDEIENT